MIRAARRQLGRNATSQYEASLQPVVVLGSLMPIDIVRGVCVCVCLCGLRCFFADAPNGTHHQLLISGAQHTCALVSNDSDVRCWGGNMYGELGNGMSAMSVLRPFVVRSPSVNSSCGCVDDDDERRRSFA